MGGLFPSSGGKVEESGEGTNGDGSRKLSFGKGLWCQERGSSLLASGEK